MKPNEAPERIWINSPQDLPCGHIDSNSIEYTRTDAFIEKACEWLKNSTYGYLTEKCGEVELDREAMAEDFRKHMKGGNNA